MGHFPQLTADLLDLGIDTFDFEQSLSDTLGDLGTPADGFDSYVNDTIVLLGTVGNPGDSLLDDLNLAGSIGSSIDPLSLQGDAASLPASLATGESILSDASALAGSTGEPAAPTPGGGGAGGGAGATPQVIDFGAVAPGTLPCSMVFWYTNRLAGANVVTSITLDQGTPAAFKVAAVTPTALAGGGSMPVTITIQNVALGSYTATLSIFTSNGDSPLRGALEVTIDPAGQSCGQLQGTNQGGDGTDPVLRKK